MFQAFLFDQLTLSMLFKNMDRSRVKAETGTNL